MKTIISNLVLLSHLHKLYIFIKILLTGDFLCANILTSKKIEVRQKRVARKRRGHSRAKGFAAEADAVWLCCVLLVSRIISVILSPNGGELSQKFDYFVLS